MDGSLTASKSWRFNMPRNTREWAHRKIEQAESNIDWAGTHLQEVREVYQKDHPEIAAVIESAQSLILMSQQILTKLRGSF